MSAARSLATLLFLVGCGAEKATDSAIDTTDTTTTDTTTTGECVTCGAYLYGTYTSTTISGAAYDNLCVGSAALFADFATCACEGACAEVCAAYCAGTATTGTFVDCNACLADPTAGCGVETAACVYDE